MILYRNEEPQFFLTSKFSSFSTRMVSQVKILQQNELLGYCYEYSTIRTNPKEQDKLFNSIWHHFNSILYKQYGEHGFDIIVIFQNEGDKQEFKNLIEKKEISFDYNLILLLESEVLFVGPSV